MYKSLFGSILKIGNFYNDSVFLTLYHVLHVTASHSFNPDVIQELS